MKAVLGELLAMHVLRCSSDRVWDFYIPLFIASSFAAETRDLAPAGALYASQAVACVLFSSPVGAWFKGQRSPGAAFVLLLALENISVLLGGYCLLEAQHQPLPRGWQIFANLPFTASCACLALYAVLSGCLRDVVFKTWPADIAAADGSAPAERAEALSHVNARLSQIDLAAATASPFVVTLLLDSGCGGWRLLGLLAAWHLLAGLAIGWLALRHSAHSPYPALLPATHPAAPAAPRKEGGAGGGLAAAAHMPPEGRRALAAYCLLYFTVLSPGGPMITWLTTVGVPTTDISIATATSQAFGFAGTVLAPRLISRLGVSPAARVAQALQIAPLLALAAVVHRCSEGAQALEGAAMWVVLACLSSSRLGLWTFDLCERHIVQAASGEDSLPVFGVERALGQALYLAMLACSVTYSGVEEFSVLVRLSVVALLLSAVTFQAQC